MSSGIAAGGRKGKAGSGVQMQDIDPAARAVARFRDWGGAQQGAGEMVSFRTASVVPPALRQRRHQGVWLSLVLVVVLPCLMTGLYLYGAARDQFASSAGFTIRQEEGGSASEFLGGVSQLLGGGAAGNADLLFEYVRSQEIVLRAEARLGLRAHFAANRGRDPLFSLPPEGSVDQLVRFWQRILRVSFDRNTGLLLIELRANDPHFAQQLAQVVVEESEQMINQLNAKARRDRMQSAEADLQVSVLRLRAAREALATFRASTQILDPDADIQGRMGVLNNLQQQLAQALVEHDLLALITDANDTRMRQAQRRIDVIRARVGEERRNFTNQDITVADTDYPRLIARYESLLVDQEIAQQGYSAAMRARDLARSNAERQSLYLALFVRPTLSEEAGYPQRLLLIGLTGIFTLLIWAFGVLGFYSLRDRN